MGLSGKECTMGKGLRDLNDRGGTRTHDQSIKSRLLYQLSYTVAYLAPNQQSYLGKKRDHSAPQQGRLTTTSFPIGLLFLY